MTTEGSPQFSIVTPSFRNSEWLKLCIASVADQERVSFEHIVQDAGSDDGTLDWLPTDPRVLTYVEKDEGMYDAVNRGLARARGEILAYLNCDEQYLPGALLAVHQWFDAHPNAEVLFADSLILDRTGEYICHRYAMRPVRAYMWRRFPVLTCSMFFRRRVFFEYDISFGKEWRSHGDLFWMDDLLSRGINTGILRRFTSAFFETGDNLSLSPHAQREFAIARNRAPAWSRNLRFLVVAHHRLRMLASGVFWQKPFKYSIYSHSRPQSRTSKAVDRPSAIWRGRPSP